MDSPPQQVTMTNASDLRRHRSRSKRRETSERRSNVKLTHATHTQNQEAEQPADPVENDYTQNILPNQSPTRAREQQPHHQILDRTEAQQALFNSSRHELVVSKT